MRPDAPLAGEQAHLRALESLYNSAPINRLFESTLALPDAGKSEIRFAVAPDSFHAAGAAHGTLYFKMLDDAAFYACNGLVSDRFLLTTAFNLHFTKPMRSGEALAEGRWISGKRRVFVAEARIVDSDGEECARAPPDTGVEPLEIGVRVDVELELGNAHGRERGMGAKALRAARPVQRGVDAGIGERERIRRAVGGLDEREPGIREPAKRIRSRGR